MPRKPPPPGFITSAQALEIIGPMLYKYVKRGLLKRHTPPTSMYGYYKLSEVEELKASQQAFYEQGISSNGNAPDAQHEGTQEGHLVEFSQATPDDMEGVYAVAAALFGHTTSAEARKPLVKLCPEGNYIIRDNGQIKAYIHIQPLKHDRMAAFMRGEIRGSQIRADDLECFKPGKPVDVLIKSVGAIGQKHWPQYYLRRLLLGAVRDMGSKGILLSKIYATSETETGKAMSLHAQMKSRGKIGPDRYAFELDVTSSDLPLIQIYKKAYAEWQAQYPLPVSMVSPPAATPARAREIPSRPRARAEAISGEASIEKTEKQELPQGWVTAGAFAKRHNTREATVTAAIKRGELPAHPGTWKDYRASAKYALDPEQQRACYNFMQGKQNFHPCPDCPH